MIEVRAHDHPFVLQPGVAALDQRNDVAIGNEMAIDCRLDVDLDAGQRHWRRPARVVRCLRQILECLSGAGEQR